MQQRGKSAREEISVHTHAYKSRDGHGDVWLLCVGNLHGLHLIRLSLEKCHDTGSNDDTRASKGTMARGATDWAQIPARRHGADLT